MKSASAVAGEVLARGVGKGAGAIIAQHEAEVRADERERMLIEAGGADQRTQRMATFLAALGALVDGEPEDEKPGLLALYEDARAAALDLALGSAAPSGESAAKVEPIPGCACSAGEGPCIDHAAAQGNATHAELLRRLVDSDCVLTIEHDKGCKAKPPLTFTETCGGCGWMSAAVEARALLGLPPQENGDVRAAKAAADKAALGNPAPRGNEGGTNE